MKVTVDAKSNEIIIRMPIGTPTPSASGKTLLIASTHGTAKVPDVQIEGQPVNVNCSVYIKNTAAKK